MSCPASGGPDWPSSTRRRRPRQLGKVGLRTASDILCMVIGACSNVGDLERAGQWADESERWMRRNGAGGFPAVCQVHRAEIKMLHGHWAEAEQDARRACNELERFGLLDGVGFAYNAIGEIRLRMGDLDGATQAFDRAYEFGHDGQPGQSLMLLARGQVEDAQRAIARAIATASGTGTLSDRAALGRLLPAQVAIALAAHDLDTARHAVEQLESITAEFDRPLYRANALTARGELLLGEDKPSEASPLLGQGWRLWQSSDLPYEAARARLHYAEAVAAEGDRSTARRDLLAARAVFQRLGATLDLERVDALLRVDGDAPDRGRSSRRRFGGTSRDQDLHVHRHRHLDRPRRHHRRRRLERAPRLARPRAAIRLRRAPRRGRQHHR